MIQNMIKPIVHCPWISRLRIANLGSLPWSFNMELIDCMAIFNIGKSSPKPNLCGSISISSFVENHTRSGIQTWQLKIPYKWRCLNYAFMGNNNQIKWWIFQHATFDDIWGYYPMADSDIISSRPEVDNVELSRRLMECRDWIGCYRWPWLWQRPFHHAEVNPRSWERLETLIYLGLPRYFLTMVNQNLHSWDITWYFLPMTVVWKLSFPII